MNDDCMNMTLKFNTKKIKVLAFEREITGTDTRIVVDDVVVEQVDEFVY